MNGPDDAPSTSPERIRRIVERARREVGLRDLATFCVVQIWAALLILGAVCLRWYVSHGDAATRPPEQR